MRSIATFAVVFILLAGLASAQTSSGRHRVVRPAEPEPEVVSRDQLAEGWTYLVSAGAGLATAGDVARIRTAGVSGILWAPASGDGFASPNILLTLDEELALSVTAARKLAPRWWLRLDVGGSTLDLAAEARVGEGMEVYLWERLSFLAASASVEYRLVDQPSFPYLLAGVGATSITADQDDQWDQTRLACRLGAGYEQRFAGPWAFRAELRDQITSLDLDGYVPPVKGDLHPDYTIEDKGPVHYFELLLTLAGSF